MASVLKPQKIETGWIMEIPDEMAQAMKISSGSFALLYPKDGAIDFELLPEPSDELLADFERMYEKYKDTCEELERLGD
ncbi:MAG: hypothetical protein AB7P14_02790 [Blastocatellales bacterium]